MEIVTNIALVLAHAGEEGTIAPPLELLEARCFAHVSIVVVVTLQPADLLEDLAVRPVIRRGC